MLICHEKNVIKLNSDFKRILYLLLYLNDLKFKKFIRRTFLFYLYYFIYLAS